MNTISAVFVVITAVFLGLGFMAINRKDKPGSHRRGASGPQRR